MTYVRLGRLDEARAAMAKALEADPDYRISKASDWPYKDPGNWDKYVQDLLAAGAPE